VDALDLTYKAADDDSEDKEEEQDCRSGRDPSEVPARGDH
jgi:hypothetical protein